MIADKEIVKSILFTVKKSDRPKIRQNLIVNITSIKYKIFLARLTCDTTCYFLIFLESLFSYFDTVSSCAAVSTEPGLFLRTSTIASIALNPLFTR